MYVVTHLPADLAAAVMDADLERGSLYRTLQERTGLAVSGGRRVVEAVPARRDLAKLLEVDRNAPLLFVESVSWGPDLRPFECYRAWHRADRTKIEVQVIGHELAAKAGLDPATVRIGTR